MVGGDVKHHSHIGLEVIHVFKLETAQLDYIHIVMLKCHLPSKALAYIAGQTDIHTRVFQDVIGEQGCGGFTVTTGDTHHLGIGISSGKLDFRNYRYIFRNDALHNGSCGWNTGAFHNLIGRQYASLGVLTFFPLDAMLFKCLLITRRDVSHVRQENIHTFYFAENCGTNATFASAQYH